MNQHNSQEQYDVPVAVKVPPLLPQLLQPLFFRHLLSSFFALSLHALLPALLALLAAVAAVAVPLTFRVMWLSAVIPAGISFIVTASLLISQKCKNSDIELQQTQQSISYWQLLLSPVYTYLAAQLLCALAASSLVPLNLLLAGASGTVFLSVPQAVSHPYKQLLGPALFQEFTRVILCSITIVPTIVFLSLGWTAVSQVLTLAFSLYWILFQTCFIGSLRDLLALCGSANFVVFGNGFRCSQLRDLVFLVSNVTVVFIAGQQFFSVFVVYSFITNLGIQNLLLVKTSGFRLEGLSLLPFLLLIPLNVFAICNSIFLLTNLSLLFSALSLAVCLLAFLGKRISRPIGLVAGPLLKIRPVFIQYLQRASGCLYTIALSCFINRTFQEPKLSGYVFKVLLLRCLNAVHSNPGQPTAKILLLISLLLPSPQLFLYWIPLNITLLHLIAPFTTPKKTRIEFKYSLICFLLNLIWTPWIWWGLPCRCPFGLPLYLPSPSFVGVNPRSSSGSEGKLFQNSIKQIEVHQDFMLFRISKWIIVGRVLERSLLFNLKEFIVLEAQEVTSCHNVQALQIDELGQSFWSKGECLSDWNSILSPWSQLKLSMHDENQIKLTGIIEAEEFGQLYKQIFLSCLVYFYFQQQHSNEHLLEIQSDFRELVNQNNFNKKFPFDLVKSLGQQLSLPKEQKQQQKVSQVQTIPKKTQTKLKRRNSSKKGFFDNYDETQVDKSHEKAERVFNFQEKSDIAFFPVLPKSEELSHFRVLGVIFTLSGGSVQALTPKRLYKSFLSPDEFVSHNSLFKKHQFLRQLLHKTLRTAIILAVQRYSLGQFQPLTKQDIQQFTAKNFVGTSTEPQFERALTSSQLNIWSLVFYQKQKVLGVVRYFFNQIQGKSFTLNRSIAEAVWLNQRFEMYFVSNDDEQRFSVQSQAKLLRNILTESGPVPLGYAPFYSGAILC